MDNNVDKIYVFVPSPYAILSKFISPTGKEKYILLFWALLLLLIV